MREAIYTPVDSVDSNYNSMMAIGIESSTDRGHLRLDEDKLKKALAADPDCVYQILHRRAMRSIPRASPIRTTTRKA